MFQSSTIIITGHDGRWTGAGPATCHRCDDSGNTGNCGSGNTSPPRCASGRTAAAAVDATTAAIGAVQASRDGKTGADGAH